MLRLPLGIVVKVHSTLYGAFVLALIIANIALIATATSNSTGFTLSAAFNTRVCVLSRGDVLFCHEDVVILGLAAKHSYSLLAGVMNQPAKCLAGFTCVIIGYVA